MNRLTYLAAVVAVLAVAACGDDTPTAPADEPATADTTALAPVITWDEASARFRLRRGESLTLVPVVANTDSATTFLWTREGETVSTESHYTFEADSVGEFFVQLAVTNAYGTTTDEVKVTVTESLESELPPLPVNDSVFAWRFPWTEINIARGRTIEIRAFMLQNAPDTLSYEWTFEGHPEVVRTAEPALAVAGEAEGRHIITLAATVAGRRFAQDFVVNVCPPEGTYRRPFQGQAMVSRVYEFMPAPGHQVNGYIIVGDSYPPGCTHAQACDSVLAHFSRRWSVSLGSQGGYLVAGFDHSVRNSGGDYDLAIRGNPFSYQSEPGIVWVSQDVNGDGLPNDQWFELAGSEYGTANHATAYAITYYRPRAAHSATAWRDNDGQTGYVPYMSYWNPSETYWQPWVEGDERTYFGSRLRDRSTYSGGISDIPPYDWGYADNLGADFIDGPAGKMNYLRLSNARTWDGQPANLEYIDFVRVQTAQTGSTPNLGDISTEVYYIGEAR